VAKRKLSRKYKKKGMMERALKQERKAPTPKPREKFNLVTFVKRLPKKIGDFFKSMVHELKRVTWPNRKALLTYTIVTIVTIVIFAALMGLYDFLFIQLVEFLAKI